jgi:hypothetical protein
MSAWPLQVPAGPGWRRRVSSASSGLAGLTARAVRAAAARFWSGMPANDHNWT